MSASAKGDFPDDGGGVLYRAGNIATMDPGRPGAEAVANREGRIVVVGSESDCRRAIGMREAGFEATDTPGEPEAAPRVVDLAGRTLLPGFHDVHLHPLPMAFFE